MPCKLNVAGVMNNIVADHIYMVYELSNGNGADAPTCRSGDKPDLKHVEFNP
jgi:hypothetical protein